MAGKRKEKVEDDDVQQILQLLDREYKAAHPQAKIEAYRQNSVTIRIRIIDPDFRGSDRVERDRRISQILERLPERIETQITLLLLLTPEETKTSFANVELEHPVPSNI